MILEKAKAILAHGYICDNCLGRQFGQLLTGMTNAERGKALRIAFAFEYEEKKFPVAEGNFSSIRFRKRKMAPPKTECIACNNLFEKLPAVADATARALEGYEFSTFVVGTKMSHAMISREESLWEEFGIEHCEPLKNELNRELGKLLQERLKKEVDEGHPDILVTFNGETSRTTITSNPVFFYGEYQKLVRGIPQTKWETYPITVEDLVAGPFMRASGARGHAFHGVGREDIDARCLDWRPFIFELIEPKKRSLKLRDMQTIVNKTKKIKIRNLRPSSRPEVVDIKAWRPDKTYRITAVFGKPVDPAILEKKAASLKGLIRQKTPTRVLHRRGDLLRKRQVRDIRVVKATKNSAVLEIRGEAGLYVKELLTGDNGRTTPSLAGLLSVAITPKDLDVVKIHVKQRK